MSKFKGLDVLAFEIIPLISTGEKETISTIEKELDNNNLVTYLNRKYKSNFMVDFEDGTYDISKLNECFLNYSGYVQGNESRKFGVVKEEDGLLLVLALIVNEIVQK